MNSGYAGFRIKIATFEKCGKVFHPLKAGILSRISVPQAKSPW